MSNITVLTATGIGEEIIEDIVNKKDVETDTEVEEDTEADAEMEEDTETDAEAGVDGETNAEMEEDTDADAEGEETETDAEIEEDEETDAETEEDTEADTEREKVETDTQTEEDTETDAGVEEDGEIEENAESSLLVKASEWMGSSSGTLTVTAIALCGVLILGLLFVWVRRRQKNMPQQTDEEETWRTEQIPERTMQSQENTQIVRNIGKLHNIGMRKGQQDSLGVTNYEGGVLAVVADGMGGLADGDKVSQKVVLTMMQDAAYLAGANTEGKLYQMVSHVNREVNNMLGVANQYKSGSTLIAVMVENMRFQWVSVGDSRIYLYRAGQLLQMNREHVYASELMLKAVNQGISFADVVKDPQKKSLSSFIGMGELRHIDGSMRPLRTQAGDRLLLCSDGVFNTLSDSEVCAILEQEKNANQAALLLEQQVLARKNPKQDNFTAIILDL